MSNLAYQSFIPLNSQDFLAFEAGTKRTAFRRCGPRFNEKTCQVGREVVVAKGYSKQVRLDGVIIQFKRITGSMLDSSNHASILAEFGTLQTWLVCVQIEIVSNQRKT